MNLFPCTAAAALLLFNHICSANTTIQCPARIELDSAQAVATDAPAGFQANISKLPRLLTGLNAYDGPPEEEASLVPNFKDKAGREGWRFMGAYEKGKWLSCDYAGGALRLVTRLDDTIKECVGIFKHKGNTKTPQAEFICQ